jgi:D-alanyl-lipoteichoic acid acyltransferase DltB (MBOAT superfamily)
MTCREKKSDGINASSVCFDEYRDVSGPCDGWEMLFNSYLFLGGFLPIVLTGYGIACRGGRVVVMTWLVVASLVFYSWWSVAFLPVLLGSIGFNFLASRLIARTSGRNRSLLLGAAIAGDLAVLTWYKYVAALLKLVGLSSPWGDPILPVGISFFTFTQIGHLLDCHAGLVPKRPFLDYLFFVTFFPHLISGPILGGREILPEIADPATWRPRFQNIAVGGGLFLIGLLKKTLLADPVSTLVAPGFAAPESLTVLPAWRAVLAWPLQLYFDFSGYSDMAVGLARMFGFTFPINFNAPYQARSVIDYWQRWHISLTRFLMNTIHAPMTMTIMRWRRARGLTNRTNVGGFLVTVASPIVVTMGLAGIWHGASLTFVVFGLVHGAFLIVNHAWRIWGRWFWCQLSPVCSVLLTYLCVVTGGLIFRSASLEAAGELFRSLFGAHGLGLAPDPRGYVDVIWLMGLQAIVWFAPSSAVLVERMSVLITRPRIPWAAAYGAAATLGVLSIGGTVEFLYFQF